MNCIESEIDSENFICDFYHSYTEIELVQAVKYSVVKDFFLSKYSLLNIHYARSLVCLLLSPQALVYPQFPAWI